MGKYKQEPRGRKRLIVDESLIWMNGGYEIFEVLECNHVQRIKTDEETGLSNAEFRICKKCLSDPQILNRRKYDIVSDSRKPNWFEEDITIGKVPIPFEGYEIETNPDKERLLVIKACYEMIKA